jgi:hypothetical protein
LATGKKDNAQRPPAAVLGLRLTPSGLRAYGGLRMTITVNRWIDHQGYPVGFACGGAL